MLEALIHVLPCIALLLSAWKEGIVAQTRLSLDGSL